MRLILCASVVVSASFLLAVKMSMSFGYPGTFVVE